MLQLYLASEDEADAIAAGEYVAPAGTSLRLPDDLGIDDLDIRDLAVLACLVCELRADPEYPVLDEPIAEGDDAAVYLALPEFVERLSGLAGSGGQTTEWRWVDYLNGGDEDGVWTPEKVRHVFRHLGALARRALDKDVPVLVLLGNR